MSICLLAIGDGRDDYHQRSWASMREMLPDVDYTVTIDDRAHELGFAGAVRAGWRLALESGADHIFHAELDFLYRLPVDLAGMAGAFETHSHLVQIALLRGPVNAAEIAAGGVIEQAPADYTTVRSGTHTWREHRKYVTTNPALWPRWVLERGWPTGKRSEGRFGLELFASDPALRAAFWGTGVLVEHIGTERQGGGY